MSIDYSMGIIELFFRIFSVLLLLLGTFEVHSTEIAGHGIVLSPENCFILDDTRECLTSVEILWRTERTGTYCLFVSGKPTPINCWANSNLGQLEHSIDIEQDIEFELREKLSNLLIYKAKLKLFKKVKKLRKKRRNPWSFY